MERMKRIQFLAPSWVNGLVLGRRAPISIFCVNGPCPPTKLWLSASKLLIRIENKWCSSYNSLLFLAAIGYTKILYRYKIMRQSNKHITNRMLFLFRFLFFFCLHPLLYLFIQSAAPDESCETAIVRLRSAEPLVLMRCGVRQRALCLMTMRCLHSSIGMYSERRSAGEKRARKKSGECHENCTCHSQNSFDCGHGKCENIEKTQESQSQKTRDVDADFG